jgi:hypothetical protein
LGLTPWFFAVAPGWLHRRANPSLALASVMQLTQPFDRENRGVQEIESRAQLKQHPI